MPEIGEIVDFDPFSAAAAPATGGSPRIGEIVTEDPFAPQTNIWGEIAEVGRGIPAGAVQAAGTALRGLAANQPTQRYAGYLDEIEHGVRYRTREREGRVPITDDTAYTDILQRIADDPGMFQSQQLWLRHAIEGVRSGNLDALSTARSKLPPEAVQERELWKAGEAVSEFAQETFPAKPGYEETLGRAVGEGLGSLGAGLVTAMVPGVGSGLSTAFFTAMGSGEAADRAVAAGATDEQIIEAAGLGAGAGATDILPAEMLLGRIPGANVIANAVKRYGGKRTMQALGRISNQALVESAQEGGQQALQNLIAREVYDPEQQILEGVVENAGIGGIVGGIAGLGREGVYQLSTRRSGSARGDRARAVREVPPPSPEDEASPIPTADIIEGRERIADAEATESANKYLEVAGLPQIGQPVRVSRARDTIEGVVSDAWEGDDPGLTVRAVDGAETDLSLAQMQAMGATLTGLPMPAPRDEIAKRADEIVQDAQRVQEDLARAEEEAARAAATEEQGGAVEPGRRREIDQIMADVRRDVRRREAEPERPPRPPADLPRLTRDQSAEVARLITSGMPAAQAVAQVQRGAPSGTAPVDETVTGFGDRPPPSPPTTFGEPVTTPATTASGFGERPPPRPPTSFGEPVVDPGATATGFGDRPAPRTPTDFGQPVISAEGTVEGFGDPARDPRAGTGPRRRATVVGPSGRPEPDTGPTARPSLEGIAEWARTQGPERRPELAGVAEWAETQGPETRALLENAAEWAGTQGPQARAVLEGIAEWSATAGPDTRATVQGLEDWARTQGPETRAALEGAIDWARTAGPEARATVERVAAWARTQGPEGRAVLTGIAEWSQTQGPETRAAVEGVAEWAQTQGPETRQSVGGVVEWARTQGPTGRRALEGVAEWARSTGPTSRPSLESVADWAREQGPDRRPELAGIAEWAESRGPQTRAVLEHTAEWAQTQGPQARAVLEGIAEWSRTQGPATRPVARGVAEWARTKGPETRAAVEGVAEWARSRGPEGRAALEGVAEWARTEGPQGRPVIQAVAEWARTQGPETRAAVNGVVDWARTQGPSGRAALEGVAEWSRTEGPQARAALEAAAAWSRTQGPETRAALEGAEEWAQSRGPEARAALENVAEWARSRGPEARPILTGIAEWAQTSGPEARPVLDGIARWAQTQGPETRHAIESVAEWARTRGPSGRQALESVAEWARTQGPEARPVVVGPAGRPEPDTGPQTRPEVVGPAGRPRDAGPPTRPRVGEEQRWLQQAIADATGQDINETRAFAESVAALTGQDIDMRRALARAIADASGQEFTQRRALAEDIAAATGADMDQARAIAQWVARTTGRDMDMRRALAGAIGRASGRDIPRERADALAADDRRQTLSFRALERAPTAVEVAAAAEEAGLPPQTAMQVGEQVRDALRGPDDVAPTPDMVSREVQATGLPADFGERIAQLVAERQGILPEPLERRDTAPPAIPERREFREPEQREVPPGIPEGQREQVAERGEEARERAAEARDRAQAMEGTRPAVAPEGLPEDFAERMTAAVSAMPELQRLPEGTRERLAAAVAQRVAPPNVETFAAERPEGLPADFGERLREVPGIGRIPVSQREEFERKVADAAARVAGLPQLGEPAEVEAPPAAGLPEGFDERQEIAGAAVEAARGVGLPEGARERLAARVEELIEPPDLDLGDVAVFDARVVERLREIPEVRTLPSAERERFVDEVRGIPDDVRRRMEERDAAERPVGLPDDFAARIAEKVAAAPEARRLPVGFADRIAERVAAIPDLPSLGTTDLAERIADMPELEGIPPDVRNRMAARTAVETMRIPPDVRARMEERQPVTAPEGLPEGFDARQETARAAVEVAQGVRLPEGARERMADRIEEIVVPASVELDQEAFEARVDEALRAIPEVRTLPPAERDRVVAETKRIPEDVRQRMAERAAAPRPEAPRIGEREQPARAALPEPLPPPLEREVTPPPGLPEGFAERIAERIAAIPEVARLPESARARLADRLEEAVERADIQLGDAAAFDERVQATLEERVRGIPEVRTLPPDARDRVVEEVRRIPAGFEARQEAAQEAQAERLGAVPEIPADAPVDESAALPQVSSTEVERAEGEAELGRGTPPPPIMRKDGSPFKTRQGAVLAARNKKIEAEPVEVEGGWALQQAAGAMPAEPSPTPPAEALVPEGAPQPDAPPVKAAPGAPVEMEGGLYRFDPATVTTDARAFQYKSGGDDAGVTERLQGIKTWDPVKAGIAIIYERADGSKVIADGHQRLGLAKRMMAEGQAPKLFGVLRREADGWTEAEVRAEAALKNIAEGSGDAFDAATVLRDAPKAALDSLPPQSNLVRTARDIARLEDGPFRSAKAAGLPAGTVGVVGRVAEGDGPLQQALIEEFADRPPPNVAQAEAMARMFREDRTENEQVADLFGETEVARSLYRERARIIDGAIRRLKQDKRVFATLSRNAEQIQDAGNVLRADNEAIADAAGRGVFLVQQLATRTGDVSDAVKAAASDVDAGRASRTQAIDTVVGAVRSWVDQGGAASFGLGRPAEPAEGERQTAEDADREGDTDEVVVLPGQAAMFQQPPADPEVAQVESELQRRQGEAVLQRRRMTPASTQALGMAMARSARESNPELTEEAAEDIAVQVIGDIAGKGVAQSWNDDTRPDYRAALSTALEEGVSNDRLDAVVTEVEPGSGPRGSTQKETRLKGRQLLRRLQGQFFVNRRRDIPIAIQRPGVEKIMSGSVSEATLDALPVLPELVEEAVEAGRALEDRKAEQRGERGFQFRRFYAALKRGDDLYRVEMAVRERVEGPPRFALYDLDVVPMEPSGSGDLRERAPVREGVRGESESVHRAWPQQPTAVSLAESQRAGRPVVSIQKLLWTVEGRTEGKQQFQRTTPPQGGPARVRIRLNRRYDEAREGVRGDLERIGRETFGRQFRFELAESITAPEGGTVPGAFDPANRIAYIALRADEAGMTGSLYHEGLHYLRNAGAFDKADGTPNAAWQTLERQAPQWRQDYGIEERYAGDVGAMDPAARERLLNEEAIAEALADYATRGRETGFGPTVRMALNRIMRFFRAMREGLRGRGFQTWESVFEADIGRGRAGARADAAQAPSRAEFDRQLQTAWTGSPHRFDKFSTDYIGTGEGAQVYGWGLYFADRRSVAEWYRDNLAGASEVLVDGQTLPRQGSLDEIGNALAERLGGVSRTRSISFITRLAFNGGFVPDAMDATRKVAETSRDPHERREASAFVEAAADRITTGRAGALYKVDLTPKDRDYLYWDRPLYLQPKKVRRAANALWARLHPGEKPYQENSGGEFYEMIAGEHGSQRAASEALLAEGVRGIKYLDQSSRPMVGLAGRARMPLRETFNYVIFDDSDVAIQEIMLQRRRAGQGDLALGADPRQMELAGTERLSEADVSRARARDQEQSQELLEDVFGEDAVRRSDKLRSDKPQQGVEDLALFSRQQTLFQRGAKEDPKAFDKAATDWSGVDLTGAAEEVVRDKDRMGGFAESVKAGLKGTTAIQDPAVTVQEEKTHKDLNLAWRFLAPPLAWSKKYPAIHKLIRQGVDTEKEMSNRIQRLNRDWDRITKKLSKDEFAQLTGIMFLGDAEAVTFTDEQLGRFDTTEKVRSAYRESRKFLDKIGRFTEQHERAMALPLLTRRTTLVRQMAGERGMDKAEFRDIYNTRAELLGKQRRGEGDPRVLEFEIADATERVFGGQEAPSELFLDRLKESDRLETRIADTKVRRRKGYVPHKFFGRWRIFQAAQPDDEIEPYMGRGGTGFKDRAAAEKVAEASEGGILEGATPVQVDGKWGLEPKWKEVAGEHGLWKTRTDAVRAASHMARNSPDAEVRVVPVEFDFPHDSATTLGDAAYFTFRSKVEELTGLSGEALQEFVTGVARRPFRRRIAGFLQYRTGMTGYSLDLDRVMRTHVGETVRYVSLDRLKFDAINTMEKEGLSAYRSSIQDRPVLAAAVQAWFRDVNGQKQTLESQIDNVLNKSWVTPLRAGLAAGALGFLAAGGPFNAPISPIVGAYVGYRVGRGLAQGGDFKTRAITGAMLGDMAHLKLGAFFNLMSALVNTSQVPLNTLPVLGVRDTTEGMIRYQKAVLSKLRGKPNADWRFLERMDINPLDTFAEGTRHKFKKESPLSKISMVFFSTAEGFNRGVTALGAMNKAQRKGWSHKRSKDFANETLDRTQFHYGASDKPELLRNTLLRVPLQFKNFVAHQLSFVFGLNRKELPLFLLSMALTAGALGIPGLDFVDTLTDWLFDFSPIAMMKEAALDAAVEGELEGGIATLLTRGVPGLAGVDMTGRVGMGDKFLPMQFRDWKGPWISTVENAVRHGRESAHWTHQMRNLSPGLGNPLVVLDAWQNGGQVRSPWKRNRPEYVATETELMQKLAGARPIREARLQDLRDIERRDIDRYRTDTRRYVDRIVAALNRGDRAAARAVMQEALDAGIPISSGTIRRGIQDYGTQRALREFDRLPRTMKPEGMGRRQAIERMAQ